MLDLVDRLQHGDCNIKKLEQKLIKFDMGGSAAVIVAAKAISQIQPPGVEVHFVVAACGSP